MNHGPPVLVPGSAANGSAAPPTPPPPELDDRAGAALIDALKRALTEPEQRLYRSGKLVGLFSTRGAGQRQAAEHALRAGLLQVTRTETRGKATFDWVALTPKGVEFLHRHESPRAVLLELQAALATTRAGIPVWLAEIHRDLTAFTGQLTADLQRALDRLDALGDRVEDALRRLDAAGPDLPAHAADVVPWSVPTLEYLDRRRKLGAAGGCPLPELFAALREEVPALTLREFHDGLRRLRDLRAVELLPIIPGQDALAEPEFALLDGARWLYYVAR